MSRNKNSISIAMLAVLLLVTIVGLIMWYNNSVNSRIAEVTEAAFFDLANQQQDSYNQELEDELELLEGIASSMVAYPDDIEIATQYMTSVKATVGYQNLILVDANLIGITCQGERVDISSFSRAEEILAGDSIITVPVPSLVDPDAEVVIIGVPIVIEGKTEGILIAEQDGDYLSELLTVMFEGDEYIFTINDKGDIIGQVENEYALAKGNILGILSEAKFISDHTSESSTQEILTGESGRIEYEINGQHRIAEFRPLILNGWSLIMVIPYDIIASSVSDVMDSTTLFSGVTALGCIIFVVVVLYFRERGRKGIERALYYDELTGIANLKKFKIDMLKMLVDNPDERFAIVKADIRSFKVINEIFGYAKGNQIIQAIADVGRESGVNNFTQGRVGTDEFLLLAPSDFFVNLEGIHSEYEERFREKVSFIGNHRIDFCYGRYYIEENEMDVNDIINKVTIAHNYAKSNSDIKIANYDKEFKERMLKRTELTNKMDEALKNDEFKVFLQPKFRISDGHNVGAEALVRWVEADGTIIFPNEFIPHFEANGFIVELDLYMLISVCKLLQAWMSKGLTCHPISVNFSRVHLLSTDFVDQIEDIVDSYNIPRKYIELELTETTILDHEAELQCISENLRGRGFNFSMDDFGSGYSSLGFLKDFEMDVVKIDKSFLEKSKNEDRGNRVVENVVKMVKDLEMTTVAEGVETQEQVEFLNRIGCEVAQGYFYEKPMPAADYEKKYLEKENV